MRINMETIMKHVSRLDFFAEAQTLYNLKTHGEHVYDRMKTSIHRIERNDLNLDFVGMTEQNKILELAYSRLKRLVPTAKESKTIFVSSMLFAQTIQFFPSENGKHTDNGRGYYSEYLENIVFTSYFSVMKINTHDRIQIYRLNPLPFFISEKEIGKEVFGLPKIIGVSKVGYVEWQEIGEHSVCDFEDYTLCRDPSIIQIRINNMCLEQLISTNRSFHFRIRDSLYALPHFEKIGSGLMPLSTSKPMSCATGGSFHIFKNLNIIQLGCNESLFCEGNINFVGNRRCQKGKPYISTTINNEIIPVIELIRPLNISLPQVYPFASDKNLILTLEEQMNIRKNNLRKTEKKTVAICCRYI